MKRALWILGFLGCTAAGPSLGPRAREKFALVGGGEILLPEGPKAVLLFFIRPDCPISNSYAAELKRLVGEYRPRGVASVVVYAEADLEPWKAECHAFEFEFGCPTILDPKLLLARRLGATVTPEAALLSPQGELLYRGRIDDRCVGVGKWRSRAATHDLQDALEAALEGGPAPRLSSVAVGSPILFSAVPGTPEPPRVSKDTAP